MKVVVDTSVWSQALRRTRGDETMIATLRDLISDGRVAMLGCIRQELLSGIPLMDRFRSLRTRLRAFPDEVMQMGDYELAAEFFNTCRQKGIQGSNTDFLICASAVNRKFAIFTTDQDFRRFRKAVGITLLE